jgi:molybdopterin-guanine dinucleotide biosynthesis protein A
MGRDKALLPYRGGALVESVARAVKLAAGSVTLVGHPRRYRRLGLAAIADAYPRQGPLGGILTALGHTSADWNLVTACDMPGLSVRFLRMLLEEAERSGEDALIAAGPSGRLEPLCAAYHRRSRPALEAAFEHGVRKALAALEEVRLAIFPVSQVTPFQNVNTPEEWARYGA